MDEKFIRLRIAKLRTDNNISARELSLQLGQSTGYINSIENGKSLPSMSMLLYICDFFKITPSEFFDEGNEYPLLLDEIINECKKLDRDSMTSVLNIIKSLNRNR